MNCLREKIDVDNAKYLMSLDDDKLKLIIDPDGKMDGEEDGQKLFNNIDIYMKQLKKWLIISIHEMNTHGFIQTNYDFSNQLVSCGRRYVCKFGVQKLKKNIKGFLCDSECNDIDMVNCAPSILLNLVEKHFPEIEHKCLKSYVGDRSSFLEKSQTDKHKVLMSMYHNKKHKSSNQLFCKLDVEFKTIQKIFFDNFESKVSIPESIKIRKSNLKQNKYGSYLSIILSYYEDRILQKVQFSLKDKIQSICFDGFHLDKHENVSEIISLINKMTESDGVVWSHKEFDNSIVIDEAVEIDFNETPGYWDVKKVFEERHFIIENPLMFGRRYEVHGEKKYQFYQKDKFKDLVAPIEYFEPLIGKNATFFYRWLVDSERKTYKEVKFIPKLYKPTHKDEIQNEEVFNSFKGFQYTPFPNFKWDAECEKQKEVFKIFDDHLKLLTNYDQASTDYLINYISHLLQKPTELPRTAIILKSKQGFGKDTLLNLIEKMITKTYLLKTAKMDDVFGSYNVGLRDRLVMVLNEVEGKDGYSNKEQIKNLITEETTIIREKYISQYEQTNYIRLMILSNNLNPIEISHDDRRFVVFKSHYKKPNAQYFDKLYDLLDNDEHMELLFNMLMKHDITNFKPSEHRPKTDAYENMKQHNTNPLYKFMSYCFVNKKFNNHFNHDEVKTKITNLTYYVKSSDLNSAYKDYLATIGFDNTNINYKTIKSILVDIGILRKEVKFKNEPRNDYYIIDPIELEEQLADFKIDDDVEEDEDDFI